MGKRMFCFQCEQTAGGKGCTGNTGVCGKKSDTAHLQDELTGVMIGLAQKSMGKESQLTSEFDDMVIKGLFTTVTNVNFSNEVISDMIMKIHEMCEWSFGRCVSYDMKKLWYEEDEDIRSLKSLILFGIRGMAAYAYHAGALGYRSRTMNRFFYEALRSVGKDDPTLQELLDMVMKVGEMNVKCMELLDSANTETFGNPEPVRVSMTVEKGPFIVVSGHDLKDLMILLEQTEGTGINIYTHGEMLPAHSYPELRKFKHLKGHFGTAWQNQQKEFDNLPAPILFTSNCLMPPKYSYDDRVYTTDVVAYPGMIHINEEKDFTPVINAALSLGGFVHDRNFRGINGGDILTTGFGRNAALSHIDEIVTAVETGDIKHFFLVGGCDGAKTGRNYYTEFVKNTPKDTIVLTLACGKFRFNDLNAGMIGNLPRILDVGQCNDAYAAIRIASVLANSFSCGINDLPLTMVLSWYEQKAVCVLLSLLYLGIQNILLGPSLPAFLSPNILKFLIENYNIRLISTPEEDLRKILTYL